MKRRLAVLAAVGAAAALAAPSALAADRATIVDTSRADTNGCVVVVPLDLAICIPRL